MTDKFNKEVTKLVNKFKKSSLISANHLLLTIFGDVIYPYGGKIWLGSLIKLVAPLGINQRLVRTSIFRLAEKNILLSDRVSRRSYYSFTKTGKRQYLNAVKRLYVNEMMSWDGKWRMIIVHKASLTSTQREHLQTELSWLGFSKISAGVYAHPIIDMKEARQVIKSNGIADSVVLMHATVFDGNHSSSTNSLVKQYFDIHTMDEHYRKLKDTFSPVLRAANGATELDPHQCFLTRTLVINNFRHILHQEPHLPKDLLLKNTLRDKARVITAELYRKMTPYADRYFLQECEQNNCFKSPDFDYRKRFGGLNLGE